MAKADLSAAELRKRFTYDKETGLFFRGSQTLPSGRITTNGYRQISIRGVRYMAHRLAWLYVHDAWPSDQIDHINQQRHDNRLCNLRIVSNKQNAENIRMFRSNISGRKGVSWKASKSLWQSDITHHGAGIYLGCFDNIVDAVAARIRAERKLFTHSPAVLT